ncbi:MAG: DUF4268 domain-containing protein [Candidatus Delongbacteria bacterium]|nr:DUF4268 domain-containing protein [Candidatus Delongbacteria bacterium]
MNVAVIFLDERPYKGEDPQIIFETLNSLGKPLTLSDLVRNFVLLNMNSDQQSVIYEKTWHPKIESILNDNTSEFFRDYLQLKTASSIKVVSNNNTKEVYQIFKSFVNNNFNNKHEEFIKDIIRYTNWYKWIITADITDALSNDKSKNSEIKELLRNIFHDIKAEAFKAFVLGLLEYHQSELNDIKISDDLFISILKTIRTYLIRRRILGITQGENKTIVLFCNRFEDLAKGSITMLDLLSNMIYSLRLPNDNDMKKELITRNFYEGLKKYSKFILGKIEEHNTKVAVDFRNPKITIEHIMPQKMSQSWKEDLGIDHEYIHKTYIHNIGNLILTEFNSEIGNKPFADKKIKLNTSSLNFRLNVVKKDIWNVASMKEHQKNMINCLLDTFPLPDKYKEKENWNTKVIESTEFSPLEEDASDIAEGNKPKEIHINGDIIKVTTWQDVFIKFIKYFKDNKDYDFQFILDNQTALFTREEVIVKWTALELLLDQNYDLSNRYKTFAGKVWSKVEDLNDNELFIHTNISASTCMNRVARIMDKLNIAENKVLVVLKDKEDYSIKMANKAKEEIKTQDDLKNRHSIRLEFWKKYLQASNSVNDFYGNSSPTKDRWLRKSMGMQGLSLNIIVTGEYAQSDIAVNRGDKEENKKCFDFLYKMKDKIETAFGDELIWDRQDDKITCRIKSELTGVNVFDKDDWSKMIKFLVDASESMYKAFKNPVKKLNEWAKNQ